MASRWTAAFARYERARRYGFVFDDEAQMHRPFTPKPGSHDDGPYCGPFLGGLGTANFSRDLHGHFNRWHLQQGVHACEAVGACFLAVSWSVDGRRGYRRLCIGAGPRRFSAAERSYATLFPTTFEHYRSGLPFEVLLEYFSPTVPGDNRASSLPVTRFNVYVRATGERPVDLTAALFWPNLLGWRQFAQSAELRQGRLWPAFTNSGNICEPVALGVPATSAVAQRRIEPLGCPRDLTGETILCAQVDDGLADREIGFLAEQTTTGIADRDQRRTLAHVEHVLAETGAFPGKTEVWPAHWNEPLCSAVSGRITLAPETDARIAFLVVHDWPLTEFGSGRCWEKEYTRHFGSSGRSGARMAAEALARGDTWTATIDRWCDEALARIGANGFSDRVAGSVLNELSFVAGGGGTVWTARAHPATRESAPLFANEGHFGLLEGFDTGYHYYNTSDLWVYAFPAVTLNWPAAADNVFDDYLESIDIEDPRLRPTYREGRIAPLLVAGKIPHDHGSAPEDPWVDLNGYALRDDPNLWKDHNPAFIVAFALHRHLTGRATSSAEFAVLRRAAAFIEAQDDAGAGMPAHAEFGDSTWDNLGMRGFSTYTGSLCLAAWAVLERLAKGLDRSADAAHFADLRRRAAATFDRLWNGEYLLTTEGGKYGRSVMADAPFGLFYASLMGIPDLIARERIVAHLTAVYRYGFRAYAGGRAGPLLVSEPGRQHYERDGGQELQVNEVLVGSAWMHIAMARHFGLREQAAEMAETMRAMIYGGTGLQFRTPAAWNAGGQYRAPLNMRPLAIWLLALKL